MTTPSKESKEIATALDQSKQHLNALERSYLRAVIERDEARRELEDLRAKQGVAVWPTREETKLKFNQALVKNLFLTDFVGWTYDYLSTNTRHITAEELESVRDALSVCVNGKWDEHETCSVSPCHGTKLSLAKQALAILDRVKGVG